ncbi:GAF domain-containing hybrid sensor histidine kinase/response regulator [Acaryochloris sp. IP29b_bin.137]|uniref:hybrid sensor histidine kinase/response regulator n=1 Tax=Acaryochloris sp. IP29b_bin.137 TaxID=2969217 RepID=UPI00260907C5|nr:GAF domain-containing hybrid sensor histidine kinase/response regulator [Acaryochloris sp. IP29b_bin.137]
MPIPETEPSHISNPLECLPLEDIRYDSPNENQIKIRLQQAILLGELTNEIRQSLDTTTIFQIAVEKVQTLLQVDRVAIFQFDPATDYKQGVFVAEKVIPVFYSAVAARVQDESFAENYAAKYQLGRVFAVADIYDAGLSDCHIQIYERFQIRATLVVPLLQGQKLWGLLCIHQCSGPRVWKSVEIEFMEKLADQLSIALMQAELHEQALEQSQQLQIALNQVEAQKEREAWLAQYERNITQIIQHIHQNLDIENIIKATVNDVRRCLGCDRVAVYKFLSNGPGEALYESSTAHFVPLSESNGSVLWQDTCLQATQDSLYRDNYVALVTDIGQHHYTDDCLTLLEKFQIRAYMLVPVFIGDIPWGLLVTCQQTQRQWDEIELSLLQRVGDQLGVALQQAELMRQLQESKEKAEAANRAKSTFLANMSHELRTPLNAILGFSQLLNRDNNLTPKQKQTLTSINRSGSHLLNLINDVLEMSKIEAGRVALNYKNCDLMYLLDSLQEMFLLKVESKRLKLVVDKTEDLPLFIRTDESRLRQVLINLLTNALKFTEQGSVSLRVYTKKLLLDDFPYRNLDEPKNSEQHQPDIYLCIDVEDTGVGIPSSEIDNIFDTFAQASAGRQSSEGSGLGLTICRHFINLMEGDIQIFSQEGQGTKVQVRLPVMVTQIRGGDPSDTPMVLKLAPGQPKLRMLIVEDNPENSQILVDLMTSAGFDVLSTTNGQEAIACWQIWHPQIILMDWRMPIMNGYEATKAIRSLEAQARSTTNIELFNKHSISKLSLGSTTDRTTIIALTASVFEDTKHECDEAGCDDFLHKPYQQSVLFDAIAKHLNIEYLYDNFSSAEYDLNTCDSQNMSSKNLKSQLSQLPKSWLCHLQQAAIELDEDQMSQQLVEITADYPYLAKALMDLFQKLQFDKIAALTQEALDLKTEVIH